MVTASTVFGGRDIPFGDKARVNRTTVTFGSEATILNVASGGAIVTGIKMECPNQFSGDGLGSLELDNLKVTVDGAAERTLTYDCEMFAGQRITNAGINWSSWIDIGLRVAAEDTLVIKMNTTATTLTPTTGTVVVEYSVL